MPPARGSGRRRANQTGAAVVDFVLVLVVLLPLVLGLVQVALVLHVRNVLSSAAAEGARVAARLDGGPAAGLRVAQAEIRAALGDEYARGVEIAATSVDGAPGYRVRVRAVVPALGWGGPGVGVSVAGSAVQEQP